MPNFSFGEVAATNFRISMCYFSSDYHQVVLGPIPEITGPIGRNTPGADLLHPTPYANRNPTLVIYFLSRGLVISEGVV